MNSSTFEPSTSNSPEVGKQEHRGPETAERPRARSLYRPLVDIVETKDAVLLTADLPGATEKDVDLSLEKDVLTIRARVEPPTMEGYKLEVSEYGVGDWERSFTLSNEIDRNRIEAAVRDGVLRIRLNKALPATSKKISVLAG